MNVEGEINDELKIYRGSDYKIKDGIVIHQPTLGEICDYGERQYFGMVHNIVATPNDMMWQLDDVGIDFTTISDWELFYSLMHKTLTKDKTSLIFGDLDFSKFEPMPDYENESIYLYDEENDIKIDQYTYIVITDAIRKIHKIKKNEKMPGNESTKIFMIEDAREEAMYNSTKPWKSSLLNLISAMTNSPGFKFNHNDVWDMKINAFMDAVSRVQKIENAKLMLQSGYSGFGVDLKKINKKQLDWLGELD